MRQHVERIVATSVQVVLAPVVLIVERVAPYAQVAPVLVRQVALDVLRGVMVAPITALVVSLHVLHHVVFIVPGVEVIVVVVHHVQVTVLVARLLATEVVMVVFHVLEDATGVVLVVLDAQEHAKMVVRLVAPGAVVDVQLPVVHLVRPVVQVAALIVPIVLQRAKTIVQVLVPGAVLHALYSALVVVLLVKGAVMHVRVVVKQIALLDVPRLAQMVASVQQQV